MKELRPYQIKAIDDIAARYSAGYNKLIFQLPTGGGKTISAAGLIDRYVQKVKKKVLFVVHRDELLTQFRRTLYTQHGLVAEPIIAGVKYRNPNADVYVTMVETANNRLRKNPRWFGDIGLIIYDEAHIGVHNKIHQYFTDELTLTVGLTATPLSSSKKNPLKNWYQDIICSTDIVDLIAQESLVGNKTYHIKDSVKREDLKWTNGKFDETAMSNEYSKGKNIENCVQAYIDKAEGTKAIVFNCNVEHSRLVNEAFIAHGYSSRHLDGCTNKVERAAMLEWFKETPGAILQNVGVLTAGFDEPSVETIVMNRATESLPLWLQCTGRGSRPFPGKEFFTIIDLGGNALEHGDWSTRRDWAHIFHNPPKPGKGGGVPPVGFCVACEAIISPNARACSFCGAEQPRPEVKYDTKAVELELLNEAVHVPQIVQAAQVNGHSPYAALHQAKGIIVKQAKGQSPDMTESRAYNLLGLYQNKVQEWCKVMGKNYDQWHKEMTAQWFFEEIKTQFGWEKPVLKLAL